MTRNAHTIIEFCIALAALMLPFFFIFGLLFWATIGYDGFAQTMAVYVDLIGLTIPVLAVCAIILHWGRR